jgi:hypothetical protein
MTRQNSKKLALVKHSVRTLKIESTSGREQAPPCCRKPDEQAPPCC